MIWTKGGIVSIENSGILRKSLLLPAWSITLREHSEYRPSSKTSNTIVLLPSLILLVVLLHFPLNSRLPFSET